MARVFITGSVEGLGLLTARRLVEEGHTVTLHARNAARENDAKEALPGAAAVVVGDLSTLAEMRAVAEQVNGLGHHDAVIHNAAVGYREPRRIETADGLCQVFAVNVLAPYVLTALIERPKRLIYLSSGLHKSGSVALEDAQWTRRPWNGTQAYSDSKLFDAMLALAVARRWPTVRSNSVEPGWVPTRMGGAGAPDDLAQGAETQAFLAVGHTPGARVSGEHLYHLKKRSLHHDARSAEHQDTLLAYCETLSGTPLP